MRRRRIVDLLDAAKNEPMDRRLCARRKARIIRLGPVMHELRAKNWTWDRIVEWLRERGDGASRAMLYKDHHEWAKWNRQSKLRQQGATK